MMSNSVEKGKPYDICYFLKALKYPSITELLQKHQASNPFSTTQNVLVLNKSSSFADLVTLQEVVDTDGNSKIRRCESTIHIGPSILHLMNLKTIGRDPRAHLSGMQLTSVYIDKSVFDCDNSRDILGICLTRAGRGLICSTQTAFVQIYEGV
jgi:hypothetical protein